MANPTKWYIARVTNLDKKKGTLEIYCQQINRTIQGRIPENMNLHLGDKLRVLLEILSYTIRIKIITKSKENG